MPILQSFLMPHPPVIVPEVGHGREQECPDTLVALDQVGTSVAQLQPETIVVITPHGPVFSDGLAINAMQPIKGSLATFGSPEVHMAKENDIALMDAIVFESGKEGIVTAKVDVGFADSYNIPSEMDHGALVPLYFAEKKYNKAKLVHITYGLLSRAQLYTFGVCVKKAIASLGRKVVVIASGDLSHRLMDSGPYDYNPAGPEFDHQLMALLAKADFLSVLKMDEHFVDEAGECGYRSLNILAGILDGLGIEAEKLSYEGPFGVGYGIVRFKPVGEDKSRAYLDALLNHHKEKLDDVRAREDAYVKLARRTINQYVLEGTKPNVDELLPEEMRNQTSGVFVSIKSHGGLRGCIGTIAATTSSVAHEIIANAVKAATKDPRFTPIEPHELEDLVIHVDILMPAEKIESMAQLDTVKYGVIVSLDYRRGLLLPNLEGVNSVEEQVQIALRKAGIRPDESYEMERFEVIRHE